jgi:hypothetical protein
VSLPRWYRPRIPAGLTRVAWWVVIVLALVTALELLRRQEARRIRQDERAAVLEETRAFVDSTRLVEARYWRGLVDSLRRVTATAETVVVTRLTRAKQTLEAPIPAPTDTAGARVALLACRGAPERHVAEEPPVIVRIRVAAFGFERERIRSEPGDELIDDLPGIRDIESALAPFLVDVGALVCVLREDTIEQLPVAEQLAPAFVEPAQLAPIRLVEVGVLRCELLIREHSGVSGDRHVEKSL